MTKQIDILLAICSFILTSATLTAQTNFEWPATPAGLVFKDFVNAYNSRSTSEMRKFVKKHYDFADEERATQETERWRDIYSRFGPLDIIAISIDRPFDLEVWLQGRTTKTWFAPEFILHKETSKIKATGLLNGEQPNGSETFSKTEAEFLDRINNYLKRNEKVGFFQGTVLL